MFDLDAYLERIGLRGRPSIGEVHRAHSTAIPFEALDPQMGRPVSLDADQLAEKLVERRRGGYCFEQNLLLAAALEAMGAQVEFYLARVLLGADPGAPRPRGHLVLKATGEGQTWHADVGFGGGPLLDPLPWGPSGEHEQAGWRYRVIERAPEYVLQTEQDGEWIDVQGYLPHPVPRADLETANWWTSTHPSSRFVNGLMVSRHWPDGRRLVLSDWNDGGQPMLLERTPEQSASTPVDRQRVPDVLAERFELSGFVMAADGRLRPAADGRP